MPYRKQVRVYNSRKIQRASALAAIGAMNPRTLRAVVKTAVNVGKRVYNVAKKFKTSGGRGLYSSGPRQMGKEWNITTVAPPAAADRVARRYVRKTVGKNGGQFHTRKARNNNYVFLTNGYVDTHENGGVHSTDGYRSLYLGHTSLPLNLASQGIARAVVKWLYKKAGKDFIDWNEAIPHGGPSTAFHQQIVFDIQASYESQTLLTYTALISSGDTPLTIAASLETQIKAALLTLGNNTPIFRTFSLNQDVNDNGGIQSYVQVATLRADVATVHIKSRGRLAVQNRSVSSDLSDKTTDIDNNPLLGKLYGSGKSANGFLLKRPYVVGATGGDFVCDNDFGLIRTDSTQYVSLAKTPPAYFFGAKRQIKIQAAPGKIVSSVIEWNESMKINAFIKRMMPYYEDTTAKHNVRIGKTNLFGLEKMLDAQRALGPDIEIGFELTSTNMMYISNGRPSTGIQTMAVGTLAIP